MRVLRILKRRLGRNRSEFVSRFLWVFCIMVFCVCCHIIFCADSAHKPNQRCRKTAPSACSTICETGTQSRKLLTWGAYERAYSPLLYHIAHTQLTPFLILRKVFYTSRRDIYKPDG